MALEHQYITHPPTLVTKSQDQTNSPWWCADWFNIILNDFAQNRKKMQQYVCVTIYSQYYE
jgi:hypothetical protein